MTVTTSREYDSDTLLTEAQILAIAMLKAGETSRVISWDPKKVTPNLFGSWDTPGITSITLKTATEAGLK